MTCAGVTSRHGALQHPRSGGNPSGEAFPVGHCSQNSGRSAQLQREACRGHPRRRGRQACASVCWSRAHRAWYQAFSSRCWRTSPHCPLLPGLAPSWHVLQHSTGSPVHERQKSQAPPLVCPREKDRSQVPKTQRKEALIKHLLSATMSRNQI